MDNEQPQPQPQPQPELKRYWIRYARTVILEREIDAFSHYTAYQKALNMEREGELGLDCELVKLNPDTFTPECWYAKPGSKIVEITDDDLIWELDEIAEDSTDEE